MPLSPKEFFESTKESIAALPTPAHLRMPHWLKKLTNGSITHKQFILILSFLVGIASGIAANLLKWFVHFVEHLLTHNFNVDSSNALYLIYPVVGIIISALFIKFIVRDNIGHGITKILYAISRNQGHIRRTTCGRPLLLPASPSVLVDRSELNLPLCSRVPLLVAA